MQIRTRLSLQFSFIVAFLLLLAMILIYTISEDQQKTEFYNRLESKGLMTAEMVVKHHSLSSDAYHEQLDEKEDIILPTNEKVTIYNLNFEKVYAFQRTDNIPPSVLKEISALPDKKTITFNLDKFSGIGIKYKNQLNEEYILISQGVFASEELERLFYILVFVFFIVIFLVGVSGYIFSRQALAPVADIIQQMNEVFPSQIGKRLDPGKNNDEITRLAVMFNNLLDKTEEAFLNQKGFLSNISHELKNPLASAIAQLEVTLNLERSPAEYADVMHSVLYDLKELKTVVEQLMALARITSSDLSASFEAVRIDELVWQVQAQLLKIHPEYRISVDTSGLPENPDYMQVHGNELLLKTAISNLCENACKFSPDHTALIKISMDQHNNPVLEIADKGTTIPPEEQTLIFKAFYRSPGTSHIKGTGIGLPLVQHILKLHKAKIRLSSENKTGNTFTISFEKTSPDYVTPLKEAS